ncbi:uncharacterized protein Aud_008186 [Aspergillus udagawae]|uniref:Uncharacterized protein n=1 Tax=Aspergillus udagawae TaxID=91492 RepID=A0A8E0QWQ5_9EURO|nr:uncharacterized protein Aud_008186 [Aspergillus udagawae]GIC91732.1 hypothetical protein Aud_008186 [Aspergillus udagawae]
MDDTYIPDELWLNREIQFASPSTSAWKLTVKIKESIGLLSEKESEDYQDTSLSIAMFECHRSSDPTQQARVTIYMQIPKEREAYERLANHQIDFTPQLVGFKHEKQDVNGLVPDGFVSYIAYTNVPGVALGQRIYRFGDGSDIPGVKVASDAPSTREPGKRITQYSIPKGLFWTMRRSERDLIRAKFNVIYRSAPSSYRLAYTDLSRRGRKLLAAGVNVDILSDDNLVLRYEFSYIDRVFAPTDGTVTGARGM